MVPATRKSREDRIKDIRKTLTTLKRQAEALDKLTGGSTMSPTHWAAQQIIMRVDDSREDLREAVAEGW